MAKAATDFYDLMKKKYKLDPILRAQTVHILNTTLQDEMAIHKIFNADKNMKIIVDPAKLKHVRKTVEGMNMSDVNVVLFRNDPSVWMKLYMGLFLQKDTIIICEGKDYSHVSKYKKHPNVIKVIKVESFSDSKNMTTLIKDAMDEKKKETL